MLLCRPGESVNFTGMLGTILLDSEAVSNAQNGPERKETLFCNGYD